MPMGRPPKTPKDDLITPPTAEEIQNEVEYQSFLTEIGDSGISVTIHRYPKTGKDMEWVDDVTIDQAPLSVLREKYGPGKYRLTFKDSTGLYVGRKTVSIAAPYTANGNGGGGGFQDDFQKTLMLSLIANLKPPPALDIGALLAGMGSMMVALRPAEASKAVDPLAMFQSILTMYQSLKPKEEKSELDRLRDTAAVIKEFASDSKGVEGPWDAVAAVGKDVVDKLAPVLTGMVPRMAAPQSAAAPRPAGVSVNGGALPPADGSTPAAAPNPDENLRQWLTSQLSFFKQKALAGKDPGFWIDYIFENTEEPGVQAMLYAIRQGATLEHLLAFDPEIGQNPTLTFWFREVYNGVRAGLQSDVDSGGEGGDASHVASDGDSRPSGLQSTGNSSARTAVS